ncbi:MAG: asparagine synthase (glutamine-hydrolyzing) [Candidatus Tagabacteria bacterium]
MCAINGFNFKDEGLIREMNQITSHRGPDGTGVFFDDGISLGHNRLSIIDLSERASQPMTSSDGKQIIIFNGEIYNYKELKSQLSGYSFRTESDTEVILAAYKKWGSDCVKKFNGIFAFAIWDSDKKELFLSRDHVGVKPLYYFWNGKQFIFSSEIKAILVHDILREIDLEALNHYFRLAYVPHPFTIFEGIKKLPAGCWLKLKSYKIEIKKYWDIGDRKDFDSKEEAREEIRKTLEDSVRHQIISDRPVGVFLSGGLDSSTVLGIARKFASRITKTYTTGFKDISHENEIKFNVDFRLARQTAKHYGTDHHELVIGVEDVVQNIEKIFWHLDEPNGNTTTPAMFLLSEMAKKDVAVVLGGDGGDELFGGYLRYIYSRWISLYQKSPCLFQSAFNSLSSLAGKKEYAEKLKTKGADRIATFMLPKEQLLSRVLRSEINQPEITSEYFTAFLEKYPSDILNRDFEKIFMDIDRSTWLTDDSLVRSDRTSMAHGLELRVPILDYRLVEISQKISTSWKIKNRKVFLPARQGKLIFREAFKEYILPHFENQPKWGWFTPMAKWLRQEPLKTAAWDLLNSLPEEYFQKKEIMKIFEDHLTGKTYNLNILWSLISFNVWYNLFIKSK